MAASMASLANPVGDAVPETALGAFFECLCLAIELCASEVAISFGKRWRDLPGNMMKYHGNRGNYGILPEAIGFLGSKLLFIIFTGVINQMTNPCSVESGVSTFCNRGSSSVTL